jgi:hypothetical protein
VRRLQSRSIRAVIGLLAALGVALALSATWGAARNDSLVAADYPGAPTVYGQGKAYKIIRGAAYEVRGAALKFVDQIYDPDFYARNYQRDGGVVYRVVDDQHRYPVLSGIDESFEGASTLTDLIGPTRQWHSILLQSPRAPSVASYVKLRERILTGGGNFLDNRLEVSTARAHGGSRSLRAYAVPPDSGSYVSKASLECELAYFVKGDNFWFSGWFNVAQGRPVGILDLETSFMSEYPGLRILLDEQLHPRVELKWADKPTYASTAGTALPAGKWVHVRLHAFLSDGPDGQVEMWIDDRQVVNTHGQTMPLADAVYDRVEIGITANTGSAAEVFVDDIKVGKRMVF